MVFTPVAGLLLCRCIIPIAGEFTHNIKGSSRIRTCNWGKQRFVYHAIKEFNDLEPSIREVKLSLIFKTSLKTPIYFQMCVVLYIFSFLVLCI